MKLFLVLSSLCVVALCNPLEGWHRIKTPLEDLRIQRILKSVYSQQNFESDPLRGGRIVGGAFASRYQFPYQTFEIFDGAYVCGGSIITETLVLTVSHPTSHFFRFFDSICPQAAHCVDGMSSAQVVAGEINLGATFPWGVNGVTTFYKHEGYNPNTIANDIALIPVPTIPLSDRKWLHFEKLMLRSNIYVLTQLASDVFFCLLKLIIALCSTIYPGQLVVLVGSTIIMLASPMIFAMCQCQFIQTTRYCVIFGVKSNFYWNASFLSALLYTDQL